MPAFVWMGAQFERKVKQTVSARLHQAGEAGVEEARRLVPVDTGQTRASIGYTVDESRLLLQLHADTTWAVFVEMGTRRQPARPFLRPGLAAAGRVFGGNLSGEAQLLNTPQKYAAGYQDYHHGGAVLHKQRGLKRLFKSPYHTTYRMNYGTRHHAH